MSEGRRTLCCWLLAAFLERGADPLSARTPEVVPHERALAPTELAVLRAGARGGAGKVRFLDHYRPAAG